MFERFTDRARRVVVLAQTEARNLNHNYIGTEHILLGLIHERQGVAAQVLESSNISLEAARQQVEEIIGRGQAEIGGHIPFSPRAKKVLELSLREALQLGHNYIGTEHVLLGLIREGEGVAAQVLRELGADLNGVRQTVIQLLSGSKAGKGEQDPVHPWLPARGPTCQWCSMPLSRTLAYRTLLVPAAYEEGETVSLRTLFCTACGGLVHASLA
jgi:ATP-dependent Clp protease ATP-binding subunit ClpC